MGYLSHDDRDMISEIFEEFGKTLRRTNWKKYIGPILIGAFVISFFVGLVWAGVDPADIDDDGFAFTPRLTERDKKTVPTMNDTRVMLVLLYGLVGWAIICLTYFYKPPKDTSTYHMD